MNKKWESFKFCEVFTFKRGRRLIESDQISGDVAYISSTKNNNGLATFISPPDNMVRYKNKLTLANSGSVGYCFFHDYEFVASDHVTVIGLKDTKTVLDEDLALFLKPVLESMKYKYNFGREISDSRLAKEIINLPIDDDGAPDWRYMKSSTVKRRKEIAFTPATTAIQDGRLFSMENWKEFLLTEVFTEIEGCKCSKASYLIDGSDVFYLGAKKKDSCVVKKVSSISELVSKGNCIAFICDGDGSVGYANYIEFDTFIGTTNLTLGYNPNLNKYNGLFLVTILDLQRAKYSFGRKYKSRLPSTKIKLPANRNGEPDWDYMACYIRSLPYSDRI